MSSNQESPEDIQQLQHEGENNDTINSTTTNRDRNRRQPEGIVGNPKDILCGRGLHILNHHGNLQLHLLVNKYRQSYRQSRRHEKSRIIRKIIRETKRTGARFLKRVTGAGDERWIEVDDKKAYEKVSHALRLQRINESTNIHVPPTNSLSSASQDVIATRTRQSQPSLPAVSAMAGLPHASGTVALSITFPQPILPSMPSLLSAVPLVASLPGLEPTVGELMLYDHLRLQRALSMQSNMRLPILPNQFHGLGDMRPNDASAAPETAHGLGNMRPNNASAAPETASSANAGGDTKSGTSQP
jgi:hypothetical protein